ncbi:MAG: hypothetical protein ACI9KK_002874 [Ascidiaceihabitans sp.]|jgi:hypothetical protein
MSCYARAIHTGLSPYCRNPDPLELTHRGTNRPYADAAIAHAAFTRSCGEEYSVAQHFRQSSRSNRSSAQDLKLTIRCTVHEFTCSGTKLPFKAMFARSASGSKQSSSSHPNAAARLSHCGHPLTAKQFVAVTLVTRLGTPTPDLGPVTH